MGIEAYITLAVIGLAIFLFVSEWLSVDVVALLAMLLLVLSGVISPEQGVAGFSNAATLAVAFMFVMSAALLKTGALQYLAYALAPIFRRSFRGGMALMILLIALVSAFVNNTPVVAVFIPVVIQLAHASGQSPSKMLIPVSYASIFGGVCTLIGTSTNILVSGIAEKNGLAPFSMFLLLPLGLVFLIAGTFYMVFAGLLLLPSRRGEPDLKHKFGLNNYLTEIEIPENSDLVHKKIMEAALVKELEMDVIEVRRQGQSIYQPAGDFFLEAQDVLKVRCDVDKMRQLKDRVRVLPASNLRIGGQTLNTPGSSLIELVITADSEFIGKNLREVDFRRKFRAIPLAIRHREAIRYEHLYQLPLRAGDVVLAEVKNHYIRELRRRENEPEMPFAILSEAPNNDFQKRPFILVLLVLAGIVITASLNLLPIMIATMVGVIILVLLGALTMNEAYEAINWRIIFLLAGSISLGTAMQNSGLDQHLAQGLIDYLGAWGPIALLSGLYLSTSLLTEIMSNNATAALLTPLALALAAKMGLSPMPFLMAVTFAASASFMTPVGYQTNAMVYSAGHYYFRDFTKVGVGLSLLFWILASVFIPIFYPF
ncbi:MAG: SLC13 family permease [Microscillaceae bacterium]|nr:SLC13 family permease [Microscillaceae bacterium]